MAEQLTVSDLLAAQPERKLYRMRSGIIAAMEMLQVELRQVDDAIERKRAGRERVDPAQPVVEPSAVATRSNGDGRFEGLSRDELFAYVVEFGAPVKVTEMRKFLATKGIERTTEAVRVGLNRLHKAGRLVRIPDGRFVVPSTSGNGAHPETEPPPVQAVDLSVSGAQGDGPGDRD